MNILEKREDICYDRPEVPIVEMYTVSQALKHSSVQNDLAQDRMAVACANR
jgi:hypothetical protein